MNNSIDSNNTQFFIKADNDEYIPLKKATSFTLDNIPIDYKPNIEPISLEISDPDHEMYDWLSYICEQQEYYKKLNQYYLKIFVEKIKSQVRSLYYDKRRGDNQF